MYVEFKTQKNKTGMFGDKEGVQAMMSPPVDEDYWVARVHLFKDQFVLAFPKFSTIGIGFAKEEDWNTNLPYTESANRIANHIWINHKYEKITKKQTIDAIKLLQKAIVEKGLLNR